MRLKYCIMWFHILIVISRLVNLFIPQTWSRASLWMINVCGCWLFDCVIIKTWFRSIWSISRVGKLVSFSLLKLSKTGLTYPLRFLIIFHCCLFWRTVWAKYLTTITTMMLSICDGKGYNTKKILFHNHLRQLYSASAIDLVICVCSAPYTLNQKDILFAHKIRHSI